tara:strand:- start:360 stop:524 length:165 start_codon:yes stop_codon:yes gene_type:complete
MEKRDLKIVERFKEFVTEKIKVHELKVFGSLARGDAAVKSGLDLLKEVNVYLPR